MKRGRELTESDGGFIDIPPGTRLGDWRVVRAIGQGRFGRVYEATYERAGRRANQRMPGRAALKVFQDALSLSPSARAALTKEADAMASINHANVLRFYDDVIVNRRSAFAGTRFFVLELGDTDLLEEARRSAGGLRAAQVIQIARDVSAGLKAVHYDLVHGDVKPENIIRVGGKHKLGDMGVAARLEGTGAYPRPGTMRYRPPEHGQSPGRRPETRDRERVRKPYDIWGLGITLHEIHTLRHPYDPPGERLDDLAIFQAVRTSRPRSIDVDDPMLRTVIERCLDEDEKTRATAGELVAMLRPVRARSARAVARAGIASKARVSDEQAKPTLQASPLVQERLRGSKPPPRPTSGPTWEPISLPLGMRARVAWARYGNAVWNVIPILGFVALAAFNISDATAGYFVGVGRDDKLAIYDGPVKGWGWLDGHLVETLDVEVADLPGVSEADIRTLRAGVRGGWTLDEAKSFTVALRTPPDPSVSPLPPRSTQVNFARTVTGTTVPARPSAPASGTAPERPPLAAQIDVKGWAKCVCSEDFVQIKVYVDVKNRGSKSFEIGAGEGSPWRLLVGPANRTIPTSPTPGPIGSYGLVNYAAGKLTSVPPNPPDKHFYSDKRDFATVNWPSTLTLEPDTGYGLAAPVPVVENRRTNHQGTTLVFNLPRDEAWTVEGIALVINKNVIADNMLKSSWPERRPTEI